MEMPSKLPTPFLVARRRIEMRLPVGPHIEIVIVHILISSISRCHDFVLRMRVVIADGMPNSLVIAETSPYAQQANT